MKRIVYTVAIGKQTYAKQALGLGRSLKLIGDATRRVVLTDNLDLPWDNCFDQVIHTDGLGADPFLLKFSALAKTDADQILFIDADSLAFRRLDPIFDFCEGKDLVVQGRLISQGQWYGDVARQCANHRVAALPNFNGGIIYYERTSRAQELLETLREFTETQQTLGFDNPKRVEEPNLSLAMAKTGIGDLCPIELDFMATGRDIIGPFELDVRRGRCLLVSRVYGSARLIHPYIFHAWYYKDHRLIYARQLQHLENLESRALIGIPQSEVTIDRFRRSIEKRLIKLFGLN